MNLSRTYRSVAALLTLTLLLIGAGPLIEYACGAGMSEAVAAADHGVYSVHGASAMPCCQGPSMERCPRRADMGGEDMGSALTSCCTSEVHDQAEATVLQERTLWLALAPAVLASVLLAVPEPAKPLRTPGDAQPPPHVRPHLAFSVLLI